MDKTIQVPPITPKGTVLLTHEEMRNLGSDYETMKTAAASMANISLCLILMLAKPGSDQVQVPRELIERVKGSQLQLSEDADGNVTAKIVHRAPSLIVVEGG
jgi:hypothetical protein